MEIKERKYTPGPWAVCQDCNDKYERHIDLPNADIYIHGELEELSANAQLIAAAPELLEALESLTKTLHDYIGDADQIDLANSAIAKATGVKP